MKNFIENLSIDGHLQIAKVFPDGAEEIIFDDHNIIVSGMGVGLAHLFSLSGPGNILEYQIDRFQIGIGGSQGREVASTNELALPLSSLEEYGENALLYVLNGYHAYQVDNISAGQEWFGYIPQHKVSRVGDSSVRYTIVIDRDCANDLTTSRGAESPINEVGLFMKNPMGDKSGGQNIDTSILVAYRYFSGIVKTSDFALVFRWTINW